ncbi:MAG TPA: type II secretion system F family protein [Desulfuromonadales bacterium]|nr:type II secretion system F family protein [Desulfuromonadales bacterium]
MATFNYRAVDAESNMREGTITARNSDHLETILAQQGMTLIDAEGGGRGGFSFGNFNALRLNDKSLLDFSYLLKLVINSGIPLLSGIDTLMKSNTNRHIGHAAQLVRHGVDSGMALSEVMHSAPRLFPPFYVQMIHAGEASGTLDGSLEFLVNYLTWQLDFKKSVRSSLTYPITVLSVLGTLMFIIFTFVFPKMLKSLTNMGATLPLPTKIMIAISGFLKSYYLIVIGIVIAAVILIKVMKRTPQGKYVIDAFLLKVPLVGMLIVKINMSRYFKIVATLHASGISADKTFAIGADVIGNAVISESMASIARTIVTGESISDAMRRTGFVQPLVVDMMSIAEKTGTLESTLNRASDILDKEVPETIKKVFAYVEPLTMVALGGMVLLLLLAVFLPIYKSVGQVKLR